MHGMGCMCINVVVCYHIRVDLHPCVMRQVSGWGAKWDLLNDTLDLALNNNQQARVLVFCATKKDTQEVADRLFDSGLR